MNVLGRLRGLLRRPGEPPLDPDAPGLLVVARAFDDAEADSAVLARSVATGLRVERPAVLRHHLVLPAAALEEAGRLLAQDDWQVRPAPDGPDGGVGPGGPRGPGGGAAPGPTEIGVAAGTGSGAGAAAGAGPGATRVAAVRVQHLDALHCAQARSRMAGLAQRLGGTSLGWDALQPPPGEDGAQRR